MSPTPTLPATTTADPAEREARRTDRSGHPGTTPDLVVAAGTVDDVRDTLAWAYAHRVPVVPRGAGSGLAGGAAAGEGIVLDLSGLDTIASIDPLDLTADVEPGVITATLDRAAGGHGLCYAPDPASAAISTIGGNIATNAGGMRCVKYGVTRDAVLGLDVVLADGRRIRTGRRTAKGVAGLDLTSLFVGSEGTLGVIVGATVRLTPLPQQVATVAASFAGVAEAADACAALVGRRLRPSMLELLDAGTLAVIDRHQGTSLSDGAGALVLAQVDGPGTGDQLTALEDVLRGRARRWESSRDPARAADLLTARRLALPSIEVEARPLIEDICVPRSRLAEAVERIARISAEHDVPIFTFAHAGDGNLHPIIAPRRATAGTVPEQTGPADLPAEAVRAADDVFALALELGGTVTGEHGIGLLKRAWLAREVGPDALNTQRAIKQALDPRAILNPGKAF